MITNKSVKDKVAKYVYSTCESLYEEDNSISDNKNLVMQYVWNRFNKEKSNEISHYGVIYSLHNWLTGLGLNIEFTNNGERNLLADWYNETEEQANKYTDEQVDKRYYDLIINAFIYLVKKYVKNPIISEEVINNKEDNSKLPDRVKKAFAKYKVHTRTIGFNNKKENKYIYETFSIDGVALPKFSISLYDNGKEYVTSINPYDDAEYYWAYTTNGINWEIIINKKVVSTIVLKKDYSDLIKVGKYIAKILYDMDNKDNIKSRVSNL